MFKKMARPTLCCGLDLGTHHMKASLIRVLDDANLELLGVVEARTIGLKDASISDITELAEGIRQLIDSLSQKTGFKINALELGLSADLFSVRRSSAIIPLIDSGTKVITRSDINQVNHQAKLLGVNLEEEIVHDFPQFYRVDDANVALNPMGLYGRKLEVNTMLLAANSVRVRNLTKAVHQAGYEVNRVAFSAYAASQVAMTKEMKEQGCALLDVGAHMSTVLFFKKGVLGDLQFLPWGGSYVTQSLAERLSLTIDMAEEIKKSHAVASKSAVGQTGEILVKRENGYIPIRKEAVGEAVNWEIENFLTHLETIVKGSPLYHDLNKGIVMISGGALLPGLAERIEERTNLPVSLGAATKGLNNAAIYAGSIGLAHLYYLKQEEARWDIKKAVTLKDRLFGAVKEVCQEYF